MPTVRRKGALAVLLALVWAGCGGDPKTGPGEVVWDRDACERCLMVLSDRGFAVQVRTPDGRLHPFDDVGCALLWLHDRGDGDAKEIWVRDVAGSEWLDARKARFVEVPSSPMGYGYGARPSSTDEGIGLEVLMQHVLAMEDERRSPTR